ncbi:hypothetical protein, partial [Pseudomonas nitroreducens]
MLDEVPVINDFPIGNSQIYTPGIADFQFPSLGYETAVVPMSGGANPRITNMLVEIQVDDPATLLSPTYVIKQFPQDFNAGETVYFYKICLPGIE